jgi:hypothetical protein
LPVGGEGRRGGEFIQPEAQDGQRGLELVGGVGREAGGAFELGGGALEARFGLGAAEALAFLGGGDMTKPAKTRGE